MYVDSEDMKIRDAKRRWLWKVQYEREAKTRMWLMFLVGCGIGFSVCTMLYLIGDAYAKV